MATATLNPPAPIIRASGNIDLLEDVIRPHDRQREFLAMIPHYTYLLYGGAAGGGKSYILRWALIMLLVSWFKTLGIKGIRVGLFCEDYPTLKDRQISKIKKEVPAWLGELKETQADGLGLFLRPRWGGGAILLRNLDNANKYLSSEFAAVGIDELTRNEFEVFEMLTGMRLRWPGIEDTKFLGATNPGQIGHAWVKQLFIDRNFSGDLAELGNRAHQFAYLPARVTDNPYNAKSYVDKLMGLRPALRKMYLEGNWDAFEGQVFSEFDREIHVCKPFQIPHWWRRWIANDPGANDPGIWFKMAADQDGTVYVYREFTYRPVDGIKTPHMDQAKGVADTLIIEEGGRKLPEPIDFAVAGMDAFNKDVNTGKALVDYYNLGGLPAAWFIRPDHGSGCRARGAATVHHYLRPIGAGKDRTARLKIFDTCTELIRTLPALPYDEHDPEAVAECSSDHWFDALRYGLQAWHAKRSAHPVGGKFAVGSAGQVLDHEDVLKEDEGAGKIGRMG